jgi:hypothetical protein
MIGSDTAPPLKKALGDNAAHFIASLFGNALLVTIALWVGRGSVAFVLFAIVLMYLGRKIGWWLSRASLYVHPLPLILLECIVWGALVAYVVHLLVGWQQPHWLVRWIFGYGVGSYVSSPSYGLLVDSSIPEHAYPRHITIMNLPFAVFIGCSILLAYTNDA